MAYYYDGDDERAVDFPEEDAYGSRGFDSDEEGDKRSNSDGAFDSDLEDRILGEVFYKSKLDDTLTQDISALSGGDANNSTSFQVDAIGTNSDMKKKKRRKRQKPMTDGSGVGGAQTVVIDANAAISPIPISIRTSTPNNNSSAAKLERKMQRAKAIASVRAAVGGGNTQSLSRGSNGGESDLSDANENSNEDDADSKYRLTKTPTKKATGAAAVSTQHTRPTDTAGVIDLRSDSSDSDDDIAVADGKRSAALARVAKTDASMDEIDSGSETGDSLIALNVSGLHNGSDSEMEEGEHTDQSADGGINAPLLASTPTARAVILPSQSNLNDNSVSSDYSEYTTDDDEGSSGAEEDEALRKKISAEWKVDAADDPELAKIMKRYYKGATEFSATCYNCDEKGHLSRDCPKERKVLPCFLCGNIGHSKRDCPDEVCFNCGRGGHKSRDCKLRRVGRHERCRRCQMAGHIERSCPELWRQYHWTLDVGRKGDLVRCRVEDDGTGGKGKSRRKHEHCYNCGSTGHYGHECAEDRMEGSGSASAPFVATYDSALRSGGGGEREGRSASAIDHGEDASGAGVDKGRRRSEGSAGVGSRNGRANWEDLRRSLGSRGGRNDAGNRSAHMRFEASDEEMGGRGSDAQTHRSHSREHGRQPTRDPPRDVARDVRDAKERECERGNGGGGGRPGTLSERFGRIDATAGDGQRRKRGRDADADAEENGGDDARSYKRPRTEEQVGRRDDRNNANAAPPHGRRSYGGYSGANSGRQEFSGGEGDRRRSGGGGGGGRRQQFDDGDRMPHSMSGRGGYSHHSHAQQQQQRPNDVYGGAYGGDGYSRGARSGGGGSGGGGRGGRGRGERRDEWDGGDDSKHAPLYRGGYRRFSKN